MEAVPHIDMGGLIVIIVFKVVGILTSILAMRTVLAVMNDLDSTSDAHLALDGVRTAGGDLYAFVFFYLGYAYFYFPPRAGDT